MITTNILKSLDDYIEKNPYLEFYKESKKQISEMASPLKEIPTDNPYILEAVRIELLANKYNIYLSNKLHKPSDDTYRLLKLDKISKDNLLFQLELFNKHNDILAIDNSIKIPDIDFDQNDMLYDVYIIFTKDKIEDDNNYIELKNSYEILGYVCGIESINILKYQKMDRIINFINGKNKDASDIYILLNKYLHISQTNKPYQRDRMLVMSGAIFQIIGLTYTRDVDVLIITNKNRKYVDDTVDRFNEYKLDIDLHIRDENNNWIENNHKIVKYQSQWLTTTLPNLGGASDIFDVVSNPKYHMIIMGIKFFNLDLTIKKILSRSNASSLTDLIMLEKINGYKIENLCVPNMTIRQGRLVVFTRSYIKKLIKTIKFKLRDYYKYNMEIEELQTYIKRCTSENFDIYKGKTIYDPDTSLIKRYHADVKLLIFQKYGKGLKTLLDIGSGQMTDMKMWKEMEIDHVIGIEPSIHSINNAYERMERYNIKNIEIINGTGDADWKQSDIYKQIFDYKYDIITLQYTIHYMIHNLDQLITNLLNVMKDGCIIFINCMDGNKISKEIQNGKHIEVRNDTEPIFTISRYDDGSDQNQQENNKSSVPILVYFKGAHGVASGSVEFIVDIDNLISEFEKHNITLIDRKPFLFYKSKNSRKMSDIQKRVSSYYVSLVFKYLEN